MSYFIYSHNEPYAAYMYSCTAAVHRTVHFSSCSSMPAVHEDELSTATAMPSGLVDVNMLLTIMLHWRTLLLMLVVVVPYMLHWRTLLLMRGVSLVGVSQPRSV